MMTKFSSLWHISENSAPKTNMNITFFRDALKQGQQFLTQKFSDNIDIVHLVNQRSYFVDQVLQQLWQQHITDDIPVSLLAVGGYGRSELHPYSDIDLLIILDESISQQPPSQLADFLTQLWDIGLEIGHSVRTINECRHQATEDITVATNLLETRLLCGSQSLYKQLQQLTSEHKTWDTGRFYQHKRREQQQRHSKYNDTANNLEPNIKESPGGLRDLHIINWVAKQHFNVDDLHGLKQKGFVSQSEYDTLDSAQRFLWRVRFALHNQAKRKQETLMINHQREIADQLGYKDSENRLAVEIFMKDYYLCARSVGQMNDLLLQLFEENIILADEPRHIETINRRFQIHNGYIETINSGIFAFYPYAMLELFLVLQQHPQIKGVRADTIRQLHAHLYLMNRHFRADLKNRSLFMEIIRQPQGITHEFRRMNKYGVLGAYLPNFGQIVGQMQHDLFHAYTVDEHTLFLVRNLRRFSCAEFEHEFPLCSQIYYQVPRVELLFIAGLFHDIAKGRGGNHSILGVVDASEFCQRHDLSQFDTEIVTFMVRQHLTMSATAQKYDIDDPDVIKAFAAKVKTVDKLNYLYLLTVADIRATNNNLWNGWRDSLLKQLYHRTKRWLENSHDMAQNTAERSQQRQQQALEQLIKQAWPKQKITDLWQGYDSDYFLRHTTDEIIWHSTARLNSTGEKTLIKVRRHDTQDTLEIFISTPDRPRIFAATTASLEQLQLNILDAKIHISSQGDTLNSYIVNGRCQDQQIIIEKIKQQLNKLEHIPSNKAVLTPRKMKLFETITSINFQVSEQDNYTIMELKAHDRPGLLSTIAQVFLHNEIQLINAKLTTLGDQVEDVFFVTTNSGKLLDKSSEEKLQQELVKALAMPYNN